MPLPSFVIAIVVNAFVVIAIVAVTIDEIHYIHNRMSKCM